MEDWLKYWPVAVVLFNAAFIVIVWALSKTFAQKDELKDGLKVESEKRGRLEHRLTVVEQQISQLPDHDDLGDVREALARVDKTVATVATEVSGLKEVLARVEHPLRLLVEHHMKGADR